MIYKKEQESCKACRFTQHLKDDQGFEVRTEASHPWMHSRMGYDRGPVPDKVTMKDKPYEKAENESEMEEWIKTFAQIRCFCTKFESSSTVRSDKSPKVATHHGYAARETIICLGRGEANRGIGQSVECSADVCGSKAPRRRMADCVNYRALKNKMQA